MADSENTAAEFEELESDLGYAEATALCLLEDIQVVLKEIEEHLDWGKETTMDICVEKPKWTSAYRAAVEKISAAAAELTGTINADFGISRTH